MNKTIIALAITAALPMAAQADATISGSVEATVTSGGSTAIASSLTVSSSEVLANGMTATASFSVLTSDVAAVAAFDDAPAAAGTGSAGSASLTGDFGTLTFGSGIDDESGARLGDVAGVMGSASTANAVSGVTYSGTVAGLSVAVGHGAVTSMGATMDFNGMTIGAASQDGASAFGASYTFGDLTVTGGKKSDALAVLTASYSTTVDALTVTATANNSSETTASVAYTLDGITVTAAYSDTGTDLSASYTSGAMTVSANSDNEVTAALDLGNADLTLERAAGATTMTYTVAF